MDNANSGSNRHEVHRRFSPVEMKWTTGFPVVNQGGIAESSFVPYPRDRRGFLCL